MGAGNNNLQAQEVAPRAGSVPVPPSAPGVFSQQSVAIGGFPESVVNMQPASMAHDEQVESPRVEEEENQSDGNE